MAEFFRPRTPFYETKRRSVVKAISWRFFATVITATVVFAVTGKIETAVSIGLLDTFLKFAAYFVHERAWIRINYGRRKHVDYQI